MTSGIELGAPPRDRHVVPAARAMPSTTGLTASRWLGLGAMATSSTRQVVVAPRPAARVVLHVARPPEVDAVAGALPDRVLELGQDLRVGLLQDVREHVQAAAVRHAEQHVLRAAVGGVRDDLVEDRAPSCRGLRSRSASCPGRCGAGSARTTSTCVMRSSRSNRSIGSLRRPEAPALGRVPQPLALFRDEDLRVVVAGGRAVDVAQPRDGLARVGRALGHGAADEAGRQRARGRPR